MKRKKFKQKKSKYADEAVLIRTTIKSIEIQNQECGNSLKTVFRCPSYLCPEGRMCIVYGKTNFKVGDEIAMKGRFNGDVFLVWSMFYISKRSDEADSSNN